MPHTFFKTHFFLMAWKHQAAPTNWNSSIGKRSSMPITWTNVSYKSLDPQDIFSLIIHIFLENKNKFAILLRIVETTKGEDIWETLQHHADHAQHVLVNNESPFIKNPRNDNETIILDLLSTNLVTFILPVLCSWNRSWSYPTPVPIS